MDLTQFSLNIGVALVLGMAIGLERQLRQHAAGLRTNALVCVGAALFVSLSLLEKDNSPTRVAGQVVTGIGFLGGGVIFKEGITVKGLATAATLWCSGAIGVLAGSGKLLEATIGTAAVLFVHLALRPLVLRIDVLNKTNAEGETSYRMQVICPADQAALIRTIFLRHVNAQPGMTVRGIHSEETEVSGKMTVVVDIMSNCRNDKYLNDLVSRINLEPNVSAISWKRES
jgi:putative Mg2+ transporter-C (MgtC) family protein